MSTKSENWEEKGCQNQYSTVTRNGEQLKIKYTGAARIPKSIAVNGGEVMSDVRSVPASPNLHP